MKLLMFSLLRLMTVASITLMILAALHTDWAMMLFSTLATIVCIIKQRIFFNTYLRGDL